MTVNLLELAKIAAFEVEARQLGGTISNNQRRFMKAASQKGKKIEPIGPMAGSKST